MSLLDKEEFCIVSMSDVIRHPLYLKLEEEKRNEDGLKAVLFSMGMDVSKGFETRVCLHRSDLTNKVVSCERFCGTLRSDDSFKDLLKL